MHYVVINNADGGANNTHSTNSFFTAQGVCNNKNYVGDSAN